MATDMQTNAQTLIQQARKLFHKKHILILKRGNDAIQQSLKLAYKLGKRILLICDQGGWMSYPDYGEKLCFEIKMLKTENGFLKTETASESMDEKSVLLINSLAGYIVPQKMSIIANICKRKNCFLINDATGSTGTTHAQFGDIVFASFGKDKPLYLPEGKAALLCFDNDEFVKEFVEYDFSEKELSNIRKAVENLQKRLHFLQGKRINIIKDLIAMQLPPLFPLAYGINVVVPFKDESEKEKIIDYCKENNLELTLCPREIRVLQNAVSIEVKRLVERN